MAISSKVRICRSCNIRWVQRLGLCKRCLDRVAGRAKAVSECKRDRLALAERQAREEAHIATLLKPAPPPRERRFITVEHVYYEVMWP